MTIPYKQVAALAHDAIDRAILRERILAANGPTLRAMAVSHGVSAEAISQREQRLRRGIEEAGLTAQLPPKAGPGAREKLGRDLRDGLRTHLKLTPAELADFDAYARRHGLVKRGRGRNELITTCAREGLAARKRKERPETPK